MNTENNQQNIPTQGQGYYPAGPQYQEDEVDLQELFSIVWKGKWIIIAVTFVFAVASTGVALYLPNEYKATAVVQPNESGSGGMLASLASQFGGLASLAGVNLAAGDSSDAVIAMEIMKSWGFAEVYIKKHDLSVPLFGAKGWNSSTNELVIDEDLYDIQSNKWIREAPKGKTVEPTSWELYEEYKERVSVSQDKETGLISVSVVYYSPNIAKQWVHWLVEDINRHMKERALEEANKSIQYLEEQINQTSIAEIRTVFSELIQEQHKTKMLAQVTDEYIFKTINQAKAPEENDKPKRALIVILGTFLGCVLSMLIVLITSFTRKENR